MRILVASYEWPGVTENCGGGGRIGKRLVSGLRARGHQVRVETDDADGHYMTYPVRGLLPLRRAIDEFEPDIIHGLFSVPTSLPLAYLADQADTPLVVTVMGGDLYDPTRFEYLRTIADAANSYVFNRASKITVPSTDMQDRMPEDSDSQVVHHAIDPSNWNWTARELNGDPSLLTVCRLVERKNLHAAIEAADRLRDGWPELSYDIVGTGPLLDELQAEHADRDWLTLHGFVEDLQNVFDSADLFVLPSFYEAFGIVFLEALAAGLPIVTTAEGGQADILTAVDPPDRPGKLASGHGASAVSEAIETVLYDYDRRHANTAGYVDEHFQRGQMVETYEGLYEAVTEPPRLPA